MRSFKVFVQAILLLAFGVVSRPSLAEVGNEGPHGGDIVALEFTRKGREVVDLLDKVAVNQRLVESATKQALAFAVLRTPVESVERDLVDQFGRTVDALTSTSAASPTGKIIQLNRARWTDIFKSNPNAHSLVFHEYLWVVGVDDSNYVVSAKLALTGAPPMPPGPDYSVPLEIVIDYDSQISISIMETAKEGQSGTSTYKSGGKFSVYVNTARKVIIKNNRGYLTLCYEKSLIGNISVSSFGGYVSTLTPDYCSAP